MPSPFPGMNPYVEDPALWSEFHSRLIVAIADALEPGLVPNYYVAVEMRTYLDSSAGELVIGIPDAVILGSSTAATPEAIDLEMRTSVATEVRCQTVTIPMPIEVRERYLEIRRVGTNEVITAIEVLSPSNKRTGKGREEYTEKRQQIFGSKTHLVEIDLLRGGEPLPIQGVTTPADYRILISRSTLRPQAELYPFTLHDPIPSIAIPLQEPDEAILLNLQELFTAVYKRSSYDLRLDYRQDPPLPSLSERDRSWLANLLQPCRQ